MTYVSRKFSLSSPLLIPSSCNPPTYSTQPFPPSLTSLPLSLPLSLLCSLRALETEWSECEPPIVEINGIWSTGYKEWQSLDSKWAKRVVRTWAVLVVRKGWREREMERWREGRRPLAVCSRTKCWIMRSDWHDPAPELRETALPLHLSLSLSLSLSPSFSPSIFPSISPSHSLCLTHTFSFCLCFSGFYPTLAFLHKLQLHQPQSVGSKSTKNHSLIPIWTIKQIID